MAYVKQMPSGKWQARWRDPITNKQVALGGFRTKREATAHATKQEAAKLVGTYVDPAADKLSLRDWCDTWLRGYSAGLSEGTIRQAGVHVRKIKQGDLANMPATSLRGIHIKTWTADLVAEGLSDNYVYEVWKRLSAILRELERNHPTFRNPCDRSNSPGQGQVIANVASEDQVWELHDRYPEGLRPGILLAAFAGLRVSELAGLEPHDVNFFTHEITPRVNYGGKPLKTRSSRWPIPITQELTDYLARALAAGDGEHFLLNQWGQPAAPWVMEQTMARVRGKVAGLPDGFRVHDLRHFFASYLFAEGLPLTDVSRRMRHAHPGITARIYGHPMDGRENVTRDAVGRAFARRAARQSAAAARPADDLLTEPADQDRGTVIDLGKHRQQGQM